MAAAQTTTPRRVWRYRQREPRYGALFHRYLVLEDNGSHRARRFADPIAAGVFTTLEDILDVLFSEIRKRTTFSHDFH